MENTERKYNPFAQIAKAYGGFADTSIYYVLRGQTVGSKILVALIVTVFLNLITFGISAAKLCTDKELNKFINEMPDFRYENGSLYVEKKYETNSSDAYIIVDTSVPYYYVGSDDNGVAGAVSINDKIKELGEKSGLQHSLFISETNIIDVNYLTGQTQQMKFSDATAVLPVKKFSKDVVSSGYQSFIIKWAVVIGLLWLPVRFGLLFLVTLIYCVLAQIGKAITRSEDDFNTIYWIAFYIVIAMEIIKTLLKNVLPFGGGKLNMLFFALIIFMLLMTLKKGEN